jgi:hypothetical protein
MRCECGREADLDTDDVVDGVDAGTPAGVIVTNGRICDCGAFFCEPCSRTMTKQGLFSDLCVVCNDAETTRPFFPLLSLN